LIFHYFIEFSLLSRFLKKGYHIEGIVEFVAPKVLSNTAAQDVKNFIVILFCLLLKVGIGVLRVTSLNILEQRCLSLNFPQVEIYQIVNRCNQLMLRSLCHVNTHNCTVLIDIEIFFTLLFVLKYFL